VAAATVHPPLFDDLAIFYDAPSLARVAAVVREIKPTIVLTQSPQDYMEDHQNTCRLMVTACFCRGMRNWQSNPARPPTFQDVYVYHANPHSNHDGMRNLIVPTIYVDIADKIEVKQEMLRRHVTQKEWMDTSQGMDSYLITMREICQQIGEMAPRGLPYAEGFRQHMHMGLSAADADKLAEVLGTRVQTK